MVATIRGRGYPPDPNPNPHPKPHPNGSYYGERASAECRGENRIRGGSEGSGRGGGALSSSSCEQSQSSGLMGKGDGKGGMGRMGQIEREMKRQRLTEQHPRKAINNTCLK